MSREELILRIGQEELQYLEVWEKREAQQEKQKQKQLINEVERAMRERSKKRGRRGENKFPFMIQQIGQVE